VPAEVGHDRVGPGPRPGAVGQDWGGASWGRARLSRTGAALGPGVVGAAARGGLVAAAVRVEAM
jgi:hypothetical protein